MKADYSVVIPQEWPRILDPITTQEAVLPLTVRFIGWASVMFTWICGKASEIGSSTNNFLCSGKSPGTAAKPSAMRHKSQGNYTMDNKKKTLRNYTELK